MPIAQRHARENARDYSIRVLRADIICLRLEPGSMVSENELAQRLGLSRTPIREALIELSKAGIVEIFPQRGSMISKIDYELVEEARFIRLVLEKAIVELACDAAGPADYALLEENLKLHEHYLESYIPEKLMEMDNAFHKLLFAASNKTLASQILDSLTAHFDRVRHMSVTSVKGRGVLEDHQAILEAVKTKNKDLASDLMTQHLGRYKIDKAVILSAYPQYFRDQPE